MGTFISNKNQFYVENPIKFILIWNKLFYCIAKLYKFWKQCTDTVYENIVFKFSITL